MAGAVSRPSVFAGRKLVIASHNRGKVAEIGAMIAPFGMDVICAADANIPEPEETGTTFAANAELKARHSAACSGLAALADDSGLVIPAIGGAPGVYSARWAGHGKDFSVAFTRIKKELAEAGAAENAPAYFACVLCLCLPEGKTEFFEGRVDGTLTFPPRGQKGFGYDPIFIPTGYGLTFAEIDPAEKNRISHRAKAFAQFIQSMEQRA